MIMESRKDRLVLGLILGALLLFPFVLNWLLLRAALVPVVGDETTWLSFWPVYISAIASFGMIYMTYLSLRQSKKQIADIKRREDEQQRARLVFSVVVYQSAFYLRIFNIGKENAYNVILNVNKEFIDAINESYRKYYHKLAQPDFIEAGKSVYILIGWCKDVNIEWEGKDIKFIVNGVYNDKYNVDETLDMGYFIGKTHFLVKGDLETTMEHIKEGLVVHNHFYRPIQQSLAIIVDSMNRIDSSLMALSDQVNHTSLIRADNNETDREAKKDAPDMANSESIPVMRD